MATPGTEANGPVSLSSVLDSALKRLEATHACDNSSQDSFLFSGTRHEAVPRGLFFDRRLTPLERNAWQVCRAMLYDGGLATWPTYEQLRPWLTSMPCGPRASHETVARALTVLRLTRWLSLARRRRDPKTGRMLGNLYVLHDEPLSPFEAMQLEPGYLELVSHALAHASKAIQRVAQQVLQELVSDPLLTGRTLPTRLQVLAQHMAQLQDDAETYPQAPGEHESEDGGNGSLRTRKSPSSDSEAGVKLGKSALLRHPKADRTEVLSRCENEVRTVPRARDLQGLQLPPRFRALKDEQQAGALAALQQVDGEQRQAVLDEWSARCETSAVRNPAGYLFGLIQRAIRGEFKAWAAQSAVGRTPLRSEAGSAAPKVASPEAVRANIARLRSLLDSS